jgi:hypothetical protein
MSRRRMTITSAAAALAIVGGSVGISGAAQASGAAPLKGQVIASGLNNPRGISLGTENTLFVTEAGLGAGSATAGVQPGIGATGSITAIRRPGSSNPAQAPVATGLTSAASYEQGQLEALGPDGISAWGDGAKSGFDTIIGAAGGPGLGQILRSSGARAPVAIVDVGAADLAWSGQYASEPWAPAGQFPDADPYGVLVTGGHTYVVDAASNTLDQVLPNGTVQILAYFPNTPFSDSVPTCVAKGPDGALYVGTLALADFFAAGPGTATVYRVDPKATNPGDLNTVLRVATVWATGFSTITGCTFDNHGNFYAAEMFAGDVVEAPFAHPATGRSVIGKGQLALPNGVAVDANGAVYVSNMSDSTTAGAGSVVRFRTGGGH